MEEKIKNGIEEYQCSGCKNGGDISCSLNQMHMVELDADTTTQGL